MHERFGGRAASWHQAGIALSLEERPERQCYTGTVAGHDFLKSGHERSRACAAYPDCFIDAQSQLRTWPTFMAPQRIYVALSTMPTSATSRLPCLILLPSMSACAWQATDFRSYWAFKSGPEWSSEPTARSNVEPLSRLHALRPSVLSKSW